MHRLAHAVVLHREAGGGDHPDPEAACNDHPKPRVRDAETGVAFRL